jgi:predicted HTH domain antitoxin
LPEVLARAVELAKLDRWRFEESLRERGIPIVVEAHAV